MLRINNLKYDIKAYVTDSMLLDYAKKQICLKQVAILPEKRPQQSLEKTF